MDTPHVTDVATAELEDWGPLAEATGPEMTTRGVDLWVEGPLSGGIWECSRSSVQVPSKGTGGSAANVGETGTSDTISPNSSKPLIAYSLADQSCNFISSNVTMTRGSGPRPRVK